MLPGVASEGGIQSRHLRFCQPPVAEVEAEADAEQRQTWVGRWLILTRAALLNVLLGGMGGPPSGALRAERVVVGAR